MTHKALAEILTKYGDGRQTGARIDVPPALEATLFVAGSDLPDKRIAGQAQLVLGVAFDAW